MRFTRRDAGSLIALCAISWTFSAEAFETPTHAAMTSEALAKSQFSRDPSSSAALMTLGLLDYKQAFGTFYIDIGDTLTKRDGFTLTDRTSLEADKLQALRDGTDLEIPDSFTMGEWLMRGAIREDDNTLETKGYDEPGGVFNRNFGHFFDPFNNTGLNAPPIPVQPRAVDWALTTDALADGRKNHFKIGDAREAMWRALTLTTPAADGTLTTNVYPDNWPAVSGEDLRKAYWATVFRSLGDVVHLLQDMGQPQHTRNDTHSGLVCIGSALCVGGHASFFEKYLEARTLQTGRFTLDEGFRTPVPGSLRLTNAVQLNYTGAGTSPADPSPYPTVVFGSYADYFGTAVAGGTQDDGQGLANYTNRGFYSFGTNASPSIPAPYPSPPPDGQGLARVSVSPPLDMIGTVITGTKITFLQGTVRDTVNANRTASDVKLSSFGAFNQFLEQTNPLFSDYRLNYYNYDDQATLVVPRAVAYSAGLIDYFFRGRLVVSLPDEGVYGIVDHSVEKTLQEGFRKIKVKVRNGTAAIKGVQQDMSGGVMVAVVKFHRNTCYTENLSGEWGSPDTVATYGPNVFNPPAAVPPVPDAPSPGCRSALEEIVVSGVKNIVLPGVPNAVDKAVEFSFATNPIPINATDVFLQVVYRGPLGVEQDAVVVETVDINEPYFTAYTNATDNLLCVANTWYFRDANGNFPESVGAYGSTIMDDVKIAYQPGDAAPQIDPLIEIVVADPDASRLEPNQSIRFAVLAPLGTKWGIHWKEITVDHSIDHSIFPADLTVYANQVYLASAGAGQPPVPTKRAREVFKARNAYSAAGKVFAGGDGSGCDIRTLPVDPIPPPQLLSLRIIMKAPLTP